MKHNFRTLLGLLVALVAAACSEVPDVNVAPSGLSTRSLVVEALLPASRTNLPATWSEQDTIGVYLRSGNQFTAINVPMTYAAATSSAGARFEGKAIILVDAGSYTLYAYYPYSKYASRSASFFLCELPQVQSQPSAASQLIASDWLVAPGVTGSSIEEFSALQFSAPFALVQLDLTATGDLSGKSLSRVSLYAVPDATYSTTGEPTSQMTLSGGFELDLTAASPTAQYADAPAQYLGCSATWSDPPPLGSDTTRVYWTVAPGDYPAGFYVVARADDGTLSTVQLPGRSLAAGSYTRLSQNLATGVPPLSTVDLSADGTANCYVVSRSGQRYAFDATVAGNGVISAGLQNAIQRYEGRTLSAALSGSVAGVVWQSQAGLIDPASVVYDNGQILFSLTDRPTALGGSAVIGLYDATDDLLWSWHIWISPDDAEALTAAAQTYAMYSDYETAYGAGSAVMMDRTLGVAAADAGQLGRSWCAPLYQWGRKDPMPWGTILYTADNTVLTYLSGWMPATTSGSLGQYLGYVGNSYYATAHAATFIQSLATSSYDWYWGNGAGDSATVRNNELWGNPTGYTVGQNTVKTLFDPCPVGWKVPHPYVFSAFTTDGNTAAVGSGAQTSGSFAQGWNLLYNGLQTTYYPAVGSRYDEYAIFSFPSSGYYWSSAPAESGFGALAFGFTTSTLYQRVANPRAMGYPVRCMQDR